MCPVPGLKRIPDALAAVGTLTTEEMWQSRCPQRDRRSLP